MEVGDLDRSGNSVDAKFNATEGDIGTGTNNKFVGDGNNDTALIGQIISFAAESSEKAWDLDAVSMGVFQQALENISFLRAQVEAQMSKSQLLPPIPCIRQTNIRAALGRIKGCGYRGGKFELIQVQHSYAGCGIDAHAGQQYQ